MASYIGSVTAGQVVDPAWSSRAISFCTARDNERRAGEKTPCWPSFPMRSRPSKPRVLPQSFDNSRHEFPDSTPLAFPDSTPLALPVPVFGVVLVIILAAPVTSVALSALGIPCVVPSGARIFAVPTWRSIR